jgi:hypothetical protein
MLLLEIHFDSYTMGLQAVKSPAHITRHVCAGNQTVLYWGLER